MQHTIRDENDFERHVDYIHINPVKHGLVPRVGDWPYSSFHRMIKLGFYPEDWAGDVSTDGERRHARGEAMGFAKGSTHPTGYWRKLSNGDIGIVTILHERMHQIDRFGKYLER